MPDSFFPALPPDWLQALGAAPSPSYVRAKDHETKARQSGKTIYPPEAHVLRALDLTPLRQVRIVILGQDPYHGPGQAHGLSFSVPKGVRFPPSLRNIFKERHADLGLKAPPSGDLAPWAARGLLLLNTVLTVEEGQPGSHAGVGWEDFTDDVIRCVSTQSHGVAFVLWGAYAQKKRALIDASKHLMLEAAHPSPLSAYRGFFGSRPFSKINDYFQSSKKAPFDWSLPD